MATLDPVSLHVAFVYISASSGRQPLLLLPHPYLYPYHALFSFHDCALHVHLPFSSLGYLISLQLINAAHSFPSVPHLDQTHPDHDHDHAPPGSGMPRRMPTGRSVLHPIKALPGRNIVLARGVVEMMQAPAWDDFWPIIGFVTQRRDPPAAVAIRLLHPRTPSPPPLKDLVPSNLRLPDGNGAEEYLRIYIYICIYI